MKEEGFALDRILFLRLRLSLKSVNRVLSNIITAWDLGMCVIFHRLQFISLKCLRSANKRSLLPAA